MRIGQKCRECGRKLRSNRAKVEDWPGTTIVGRGDLCLVCLRALKAGRDRVTPYEKRPDECVACGRPVRGKSTPACEAPGTVQYGAKGRCNSCYLSLWRGRGKVTPRPDPVSGCRGCERPTRSANQRASDYPGTVPRRRNGFCGRCVNDGTEAAVLAANGWRDRLKSA